MRQSHLDGLNPQQRDAVICRADIVYVNAGPGTGKTHMLTSKLLDYILSSPTPQKIVALSYTNTAARQIGERFERKLRQESITREYSFFNGTIHSFCYRMMKSYSSDLFNYVILDDEELQELASDIREQFDGKAPVSSIIDCLKSKFDPAMPALFATVSKIKQDLKVVSVHDILTHFVDAVNNDNGFRRWISDKVTVMAVDEAQDLTLLNYTILDRLLSIVPRLKVFLVGDPRQNIFEFNGGSYKHLDGFLSRHPGHVMKSLTITYRCKKALTEYVNTFRFSDCDNLRLQSHSEETGTVLTRQYRDELTEARSVLEDICRKRSLSSCAVISNNLKYLETLTGLLRDRMIPYRVFGGRKLLKKHVRFLNHVLRIIDSENAYSIRKIAQYAGIDIMRDGKKRKSAFFDSDLGRLILDIRDVTKGRPFSDVMAQVIGRIMCDPSDSPTVKEDYRGLLDLSLQYETIQDYLLGFATDKERFSPFYMKDYEECLVPVGDDFLTLSTIHSAKGLEWDNVYVMGLCEGNFPNPFFCQGKSPEEQEEFYNAEWKKMYVAATRARESLFLSYSSTIRRKGYTFLKAPSRFIANQINNEDTRTNRHPLQQDGRWTVA